MASTIQLKTGTGSAVPSSLTQGEVAINVDNGLIYYTDLVDFIEPFKGDYSAVSRYAVDCINENQKWLSLTTFSKGMGKGDINNLSNPNEVIFPQSNTIYFFIIKNVCNYRK